MTEAPPAMTRLPLLTLQLVLIGILGCSSIVRSPKR